MDESAEQTEEPESNAGVPDLVTPPTADITPPNLDVTPELISPPLPDLDDPIPIPDLDDDNDDDEEDTTVDDDYEDDDFEEEELELSPTTKKTKKMSRLEEMLLKQQADREKAREDLLSKQHHSPQKPPFSPFSPNDSVSFTWDIEPMLPGDDEQDTIKTLNRTESDLRAQDQIIESVKEAIEETHSKLYDAFHIMDKSKKGNLTSSELLCGLCELDIGIHQDILKRFVDSIVLNDDGLISFQDFFNVFDTAHVDLSKQSWSPPSPNRTKATAQRVLEEEDLLPEESASTILAGNTSPISKTSSSIGQCLDVDDEVSSAGHPSLSSIDLQQDVKGVAAPSKEIAKRAQLKITVHEAHSLADPKRSPKSTASFDVYCTCNLEREKFKTSVIGQTTSPVWKATHTFGVTHGLPETVKGSNLLVRVKQSPKGKKGHEIGHVIIPIWALLESTLGVVETEGEDKLVIKRWFNLRRKKRRSFHFGRSFLPRSPSSTGHSSEASSTGPLSPESTGSMDSSSFAGDNIGKVLLSLDLSFESLDMVREGLVPKNNTTSSPVHLRERALSADGKPLTVEVGDNALKSSRVLGKPRSPELQEANQNVIQAKLEVKRANKRTESMQSQVEEERALRERAEERAKEAEAKLRATIFEMNEKQVAREQDLRAEIQLLRLKVEEGPHDEENKTNLSEALQNRIQYEKSLKVEATRNRELEELVQLLQDRIKEINESYSGKLKKSEEDRQVFANQVEELKAIVEEKKTVSEQGKHLLRQNQILEEKLQDAIAAKAKAEAKRDYIEQESVQVFAAAGKRVETSFNNDDDASQKKNNSKEVDRLVETISQLNRVIDQLRRSEENSRMELRNANIRVQENTAELGKLAAENEVQARELARTSEDLAKSSASLRSSYADKSKLERAAVALKSDLERERSEKKQLKREGENYRDLTLKLQGDIDMLHMQLGEANEKLRLVTNDLLELRRYRSGSAAHLHAQSLTIQRLKSEEKSSKMLTSMQLNMLRKDWEELVFRPLVGLRQGLSDLKAPIRLFPSIIGDALERFSVFVEKKDLASSRSPLNRKLPVERVSGNHFNRGVEIGDARTSYEMEKRRRRRLLQSRGTVRVICTAYDHIMPGTELASSTSLPTTPSSGLANAYSTGNSGLIQVEPLLKTNELMVHGESVNRCFSYDHIYTEDQPLPPMAKASSSSSLSTSISKEVLPLVDALFDGDRSIVVSSGPASNTTTNCIVNSIYDIIEQNDASSSSVAVTISCIDIYLNQVYDMLANPSGKSNNVLFQRINFDRALAQTTGRVNLEDAGLTVVEVRSRYEASLVAAMGCGNRAAASASRNMYENQSGSPPPESHLVFTISIETSDVFSGKISTGKIHIVELSSSIDSRVEEDGVGGEISTADESVEDLVQVLGAMLNGAKQNGDRKQMAAQVVTGRSPRALERLFSQTVLLGVLRDCLDQDMLDIAPTINSDCHQYHFLVHTSLTLTNTRNADLVTALQFALALRTSVVSESERYHMKSDGADKKNNKKKQRSRTPPRTPAARAPLRGKSRTPPSPPPALTLDALPLTPVLKPGDRAYSPRRRKKSSPKPKRGKQPPTENFRARNRVLEALVGQTEGMLHALFMSMDIGRTGSLTLQNFRKGLHRIDPSLTKREIELFMSSMDKNRDGKIDFQEFFRVLGDARSGNQHQIFLSDKNAYKIALRERKKIREKLSPGPDRTEPETFTFSNVSTPMSGSNASSVASSKRFGRQGYLLGYTPPVNFQKSLRK